MSDAIIQVENLGKKYIIGHQQEGNSRYVALRDVLSDGARALGQRLRHPGKPRVRPNQEEFWALKDVSFEVKQGEVVGIIGRNGAGKSTLLKILSRITEPTEGRVRLKGRVASLLEVGTGFHPELTGRENIFLNGAILGMSRAEINRKFDEIVEFAEVSRFLDTPVKRYSSGMYVRLAFAVAAHLEPEILVVDEVLAVGDAAFQKKCLGKMETVSKEGRTVLFVSHNMAAIEFLCTTGLLLQKGGLAFLGHNTQAISQYLANSTDQYVSLRDRTDRQGNGEIKVVEVKICGENGDQIDVIQSGQTVDIYLYFDCRGTGEFNRVLAGISFRTELDQPVFLHHNRLIRKEFDEVKGKGIFIFRLFSTPLPPGTYKVGYSIMANNGLDGIYYDSLKDAFGVTVVDGDFYNSGEIPPLSHGVCLVRAEWKVESLS